MEVSHSQIKSNNWLIDWLSAIDLGRSENDKNVARKPKHKNAN